MTARKLSEVVAKAKRAPYELELDDGTVVSVAHPNVAVWREAVQADGMADFLRMMDVPDDDAAKVNAFISGQPLGAESALVADMRNYFQLGN